MQNNLGNELQIKKRRVSTLYNNPNNARVHSEYQISQLAESIREFGFNNPLLIDEQGNVIAGHGRLEAAKQIGLTEVPVIVLAHLSDRQKAAFALADNRITLNSSWDMQKLTEEVSKLADKDFDLSLIGFSEEELDMMLRSSDLLPDIDTYTPPTEAPGKLQQVQNPASLPPKPSASHDAYSTFEMVMLHENKLRLVEILNNVRNDYAFTKLEEALMHVVDFYQTQTKDIN